MFNKSYCGRQCENTALQRRWNIFIEQQETANYLMWSNLAFYTVLYGSFVGSQLCGFRRAGRINTDMMGHIVMSISIMLIIQHFAVCVFNQSFVAVCYKGGTETILDAVNPGQSERWLPDSHLLNRDSDWEGSFSWGDIALWCQQKINLPNKSLWLQKLPPLFSNLIEDKTIYF